MHPSERCRRLEQELTAQESVLAWLERAHEADSLERYARGTIGADPVFPGFSANVISEGLLRGHAHLSASMAAPLAEVGRRDALFLYALVMAVEEGTAATMARLWHVSDVTGPRLGAVFPDGRDGWAEQGGFDMDRARTWLAEVHWLLGRYRLEVLARCAVEEHYLQGIEATFPATRRRWAELGTWLDGYRVLMGPGSEFGRRLGSEAATIPEPSVDDIDAREAVMIDDARIAAHTRLGEHERAEALVLARLAMTPAQPAYEHPNRYGP